MDTNEDKIAADIAQLESDEASAKTAHADPSPVAVPADGPTASNEVAATAPAGATGEASAASVDGAKAASPDIAAQVDALFDRDIRGTRMGNDTELWNLVFSFKEGVKALIAS